MVKEKIFDDIYRIEVPLPGNPLKSLNSYLILGDQRHLLIDTGFNQKESLAVLESAFADLRIKREDLDIFITHLHADHSGLVSSLMTPETKVYSSRTDGNLINSFSRPGYWEEMSKIFQSHGMPNILNDKDKGIHPGQLFSSQKEIDFTFVEEGTVIKAGKYNLQCIHTPGHTPGHMCLYDGEHKILFSGDHILGDITPVICIEEGMENPLTLYLESLEKINQFEVKFLLTAHRRRVEDVHVRIEELKEHHRKRLEEVLDILAESKSSMNAYQVAQQMHWHISCKSWEAFPRQQRWFATGEAMAHLLYLHEKDMIGQDFDGGKYTFYENNRIAQGACGSRFGSGGGLKDKG